MTRARIMAKAALFAPPPARLADGRRDLVGLTREELAAEVAGIGEAPFRAKQIWHWIYHQGETDFARMTTMAKPMRDKLAGELRRRSARDGGGPNQHGRHAEVPVPVPRRAGGRDGLYSRPGGRIAARGLPLLAGRLHPLLHFLPYRHAAADGATSGLPRSSASSWRRGDSYGEWPSPKGETPRLLSTIVLMGMGEPLYNYDNVARAMRIVMDGEGIALSRRRITLSTSGVVPMMDRAGAELGVNLAVSLHAVRDELRDELVPLNRKYPIAELIAACRRYPAASNARRITFEYVMLKGINDSEADARLLVELIAGLPAKVNLIPFNPWPGSAYETSTPAAIRRLCGDRHGCRLCGAGSDAPRTGHSGGLRAAENGDRSGTRSTGRRLTAMLTISERLRTQVISALQLSPLGRTSHGPAGAALLAGFRVQPVAAGLGDQ